MPRFSWPHSAFLSLIASLTLYGTPSCSSDAASSDAIYEGGATDEALNALLAAQTRSDPSGGPAFLTPKGGDKLPGAAPAKFTWKASGTALLRSPALRPAPAHALTRAPWGPERAAHAHGDPVNGRTFLVTFSKPGNDKLLRVFTTRSEYQPDATAWGKLKAAGAPVTATLTTAVFENNRLVQGQTPVVGPGITFTVEP